MSQNCWIFGAAFSYIHLGALLSKTVRRLVTYRGTAVGNKSARRQSDEKVKHGVRLPSLFDCSKRGVNAKLWVKKQEKHVFSRKKTRKVCRVGGKCLLLHRFREKKGT